VKKREGGQGKVTKAAQKAGVPAAKKKWSRVVEGGERLDGWCGLSEVTAAKECSLRFERGVAVIARNRVEAFHESAFVKALHLVSVSIKVYLLRIPALFCHLRLLLHRKEFRRKRLPIYLFHIARCPSTYTSSWRGDLLRLVLVHWHPASICAAFWFAFKMLFSSIAKQDFPFWFLICSCGHHFMPWGSSFTKLNSCTN